MLITNLRNVLICGKFNAWLVTIIYLMNSGGDDESQNVIRLHLRRVDKDVDQAEQEFLAVSLFF